MLYDLVLLRNLLQEKTVPDNAVNALGELKNNIAAIKTSVSRINDNHVRHVDSILAHYDNLIEQAKLPVEQNKSVINELNESIARVAHELYSENYVMEQQEQVTVDFVREKRRLDINEDTEQLIKQKILFYTNWR